ncbi:hypothetical protein K402DRAFT_335162 [Aulographum hederae CBS 113979]|uniref:Protein BCP1 n=1 Tax=Aulographum hederae CBS 113979 TaxID=1176131 RepID=A0A6G1GVY4_9PEZI|nr:hypothetical protein K402DRAFT_335162 [Aulographum hederae CBS 113979]
MPQKRKQPEDSERKGVPGDDESDDDDTDMINVDFEWFSPKPEVDFHGLKTLLKQLFDADAQLFNLSELVNIILSQPGLGSTVKTEGDESDPFAFMTVLNLHQHRENQAVKDLTQYLIQKSSSSSSSLAQIPSLLSPSSNAQVGLILTERFINMPSEIVPPMYKFLSEEISLAVQAKEPFQFSHYLIVSKTYKEIESKLDQEDDRPAKKSKGSKDEAVFYFHPEDEALHQQALGFGDYDYSKQGDEGASDSKRAFQELGVKPSGHIILVEGSKFEEAVRSVGEYLGAA